MTEPASWGCAALPSPQAESGSWVQTIKRYKRLGTTLVALQAPFVSKNWPRCQGFVLNMTYRWGICDAGGFTGLVASCQIISIASWWVHLWFAYATWPVSKHWKMCPNMLEVEWRYNTLHLLHWTMHYLPLHSILDYSVLSHTVLFCTVIFCKFCVCVIRRFDIKR